ncbi:MAG: redoxin domain-containing protein [Actinophytocola sp.]|nr:redoxin domain-containing protein [Actinophytocola sp.]
MDEPDDDAGDDSADDSGAAKTVPATLDFTAITVSGESFEGASLAGKPTVLWFWAPWCPVCASQASAVAELAETHAGELNVIGVAGLDEQAAMEDFIATNGVDGVTHLSDEEGTVWKRFEVTEQSSFVLLDADGEQRYRQGYRESDELSEHVDELLP